MSVIVLGLSHRTATIELLEQAALDADQQATLLQRLSVGEHVSQPWVLATCNRIEIYAEAGTFHGALSEITDALCEITGLSMPALRNALYAHYDERAIAHLFTVAAGLDSMAVGETQILGQLRTTLRQSIDEGRVGPAMIRLVENAIRVGKRAHAHTDIDSVSRSLVERSLSEVGDVLGHPSGLRVLVVGAGAMSALTVHTLVRHGFESITVVNRTYESALNLAVATGATARPFNALIEELAYSDLVISCTGATGWVITPELVRTAGLNRSRFFIDLALPRDISPEVNDLTDSQVITLADLGRKDLGDEPSSENEVEATLAQAQALVAEETATYVAARRSESAGPVVTALRQNASAIMESELQRLYNRVPDLSEHDRELVHLTMHRVVTKLLHAPTVRVKELVSTDNSEKNVAELLATLFDLNPHDSKVSRIPPEVPR